MFFRLEKNIKKKLGVGERTTNGKYLSKYKRFFSPPFIFLKISITV